MENNLIKTVFYTVIAFLGGCLGNLFGGIDTLFLALLTCSIIDFISGVFVAVVFKNSTKTETGAAQSRAGFKGLVKKIFIYLLIIVVVKIDIVAGTNGFLRNAVIIGFMCNEVLSIIENTGLMGLKMPQAVINAVDVLKAKSEKREE